MRLWMALVLINLVIQFVVDPAIQLMRLDYFTVEQAQWAILEPYGLKTSDGLNIAAMLINPFFWYELLSRYVGWDYDVFKGSIWGVGIRLFLVTASVPYLVVLSKTLFQGAGSSISRFLGGTR